MRPVFAIVTLSLGFWALTAAAQQAEWVRMAPKEGKCEIYFPAAPKNIPQKNGVQLIQEREGGKAALMFQFNDVPNGIDISNANIVKLAFNGGRDALLKALKGSKIVAEKDLVVGGKYPARDLDVDFPAVGIYRVRMILTGPKMYQVSVLGPATYQDSAEAKKFMKSFKFLQ